MVGGSGSGSLMRLSLRCWLERPSSEGLMRLEDLLRSSQESTPVALSKRPQCLMVTAWKLSSSPWSPLQGGSFSWYGSRHPSEHVIQERARQKPHSIFWLHLGSYIPSLCFIFCWSRRPTLIQYGRGLHNDTNTRRWGLLNSPWKLAITKH